MMNKIWAIGLAGLLGMSGVLLVANATLIEDDYERFKNGFGDIIELDGSDDDKLFITRLFKDGVDWTVGVLGNVIESFLIDPISYIRDEVSLWRNRIGGFGIF